MLLILALGLGCSEPESRYRVVPHVGVSGGQQTAPAVPVGGEDYDPDASTRQPATGDPNQETEEERKAREAREGIVPDGSRPLPETHVAAAAAPTHVGTLSTRISAKGLGDTCDGEVKLQHTDGAWIGVASCSFGGPLMIFGDTEFAVTLEDGLRGTTGDFVATRGPIEQKVKGTVEGGTLTVPIEGETAFDDGIEIEWKGSFTAAPVD